MGEYYTFSAPFTYNGAGSKYVVVELYVHDFERALMEKLAASMGGSLLILNNTAEEKAVANWLRDYTESIRLEANISEVTNSFYLDYTYDAASDTWVWGDGNSYVPTCPINFNSLKHYQYAVYAITASKTISRNTEEIENVNSSYSYPYVLEFPATLTDDEIMDGLADFDYSGWKGAHLANITNNAILNPVRDTNSDHWMQFVAPSYDGTYYSTLAGNYWGTESTRLIDQMIQDGDDLAGILADIQEDPILTLESESLEDIYPFSTNVWLEDAGGNKVTSAAPGGTYEVHVTYNRDMDTSVQPTVTYGPAAPYTDLAVRGDWVSDREWVGETTVSPVTTQGTQYFRTVGGCAADDGWLVCGTDILRFGFDVSSVGALAMLPQASGGANRVNLSWAQNDYDTLAGYNLYRSSDPDSPFTQINTSIITGTSYVDTAVEPGVTYYYYFKMVNTEGNEEPTQSNTVSGTPIDNIPPALQHIPVTAGKAGSPITLSATATDNIAVTDVKLCYRIADSDSTNYYTNYVERSMTPGDDHRYVATIPGSHVTADGVDYYIIAFDGDGNTACSGTLQVPNHIAVDGNPYISSIVPAQASVSGGSTVTVLGGNFTEDLTLRLDGDSLHYYTPDSGTITFTAPPKGIGSYAVTLTTPEGLTVQAPNPLAYTDAAGIVQIPTSMTMVSGVASDIPLYVSVSGELVSFHAELDISPAAFQNISVAKADSSANFTLTHNYDYADNTLKISCASADDFNSGDEPLLYISVTPTAVTGDQLVPIGLHDVTCNGADMESVISGTALVKPNFTLHADVRYFNESGAPVPGVTVSAAGISGVTDGNGTAVLTQITKADVTVVAAKPGVPSTAVSGNDAVVILKYSIGTQTLSEYQFIAADVSGDGRVNEYDASLILQLLVERISTFPYGRSWVFSPATVTASLADGSNTVSFLAIAMGDADGSWNGDDI